MTGKRRHGPVEIMVGCPGAASRKQTELRGGRSLLPHFQSPFAPRTEIHLGFSSPKLRSPPPDLKAGMPSSSLGSRTCFLRGWMNQIPEEIRFEIE